MTKPSVRVPDYFKDLPDDANLNSRDVAAIFGYAKTKNLTDAYQHGRIPEPDFRLPPKLGKSPHIMWKVKTIREWIENANTRGV